MDEVSKMREAIARERGIGLYAEYSEAEAAHRLGIDHSTLKVMRRQEKVPYVRFSARKIRYLGIHIVDLIGWGDKWRDIQSASFKSENTGSPSEKAAPRGAAPGSTQRGAKPEEYHLAQTILARPSKG